MNTPRFIFVTGGVVSSLGKGIISSSIGKLLQSCGYRVTIQKMDPYINIDPGTLNPYEHGECYVTEDGMETDLDLGHYERFTGIRTTRRNSVTTGKIYQAVIEKERRGDFLGKTIQVVPHITDEIKRRITANAEEDDFDFIITEIGGTIGDIESARRRIQDQADAALGQGTPEYGHPARHPDPADGDASGTEPAGQSRGLL